MQRDIDALQKLPIFGAFDANAISELCRSSETLKLAAGEALFRAGDRSEGGYLIVSGCIEVRGSSDPSSRVFVYPGSLIGEMALIADIERSVDAIAHERTDVRKIMRTTVTRLLQKDPLSATRLRAFLETKAGELARTLTSFGPAS